MVQGTGKYTVITGAGSGIGYEAAKAFAERGKNLVITAKRGNNLEMLKWEVLEKHPDFSSKSLLAENPLWFGGVIKSCILVALLIRYLE